MYKGKRKKCSFPYTSPIFASFIIYNVYTCIFLFVKVILVYWTSIYSEWPKNCSCELYPHYDL